MVATTRRTNANTPARWEAARIRAITERITVIQDPTTGCFYATATIGLTRYAVSWYECSCPARAAGDLVCKHRSAYSPR
jgi:hypothetical protein